MNKLSVALFALGLVGFTPVMMASADDDVESPPAQHEQDKSRNPMHEMGMLLRCEAMHLVLSHVYAETAATIFVAAHDQPMAEAMTTSSLKMAFDEYGKITKIHHLIRESIIPQISKAGVADEEISTQINGYLGKLVQSIVSTVHNPKSDLNETKEAISLLHQQSSACDKYVAETDSYYTI